MSGTSTPTWRFGTAELDGRPATVLEVDERLIALDALLDAAGVAAPRETSVLALLQRWEESRPLLADLAARAGALAVAPLDADAIAWLPPVLRPGKLVCAGANYRDHLDEVGADFSSEWPRCFFKPTSTCLAGSGHLLELPAKSQMVDWEAELAIVIGRRAKHVSGPAVLDTVAGYTVFNDLSARDWNDQWLPMIGMDLVLAKGFDGFAPLGPLITPAELVGDPQALDVELTVNGVVKQAANTHDMIFGVQAILEHLLSFMTLEPGDVIATGSPAGVGFARDPQEFLQPGDEVVVRIERLGRPLVTRVGAREQLR